MPGPTRGAVVLVAGGVYATKPRPAVVIQDDHFAATESVTVCPMTTHALDAPLLRIPVPPSPSNGLDAFSYLMVDKITTVRRSGTGDVLGHLSADQMTALDRGLAVFLGLAS